MSEMEEAGLRVAMQLLGDTLDPDDKELQEALRQLRALVVRRYGRIALQEEPAPATGPRDVVIGLKPVTMIGRAIG